MAKVYGLHEITLHPGVNEAEFERFVTKESLPVLRLSAVKASLLKGDRGKRDGQYLLMFEIESVDVRDQHFPTDSTYDEEVQQMIEAHQNVFEKWRSFGTVPGGDEYAWTDYVVVGE